MKEVIDQVHIRKNFAVSKAELYSAWVEEAELKQWWMPMNKHLLDVQNEIKEGGSIAYRFENDLTIDGQYREVQPEEKLVYSWNWEVPGQNFEESKYRLSVVFTGQDNSSRLEVRQENFADEEAIHPHREGWDKALNDLQQYLTTAS